MSERLSDFARIMGLKSIFSPDYVCFGVCVLCSYLVPAFRVRGKIRAQEGVRKVTVLWRKVRGHLVENSQGQKVIYAKYKGQRLQEETVQVTIN